MTQTAAEALVSGKLEEAKTLIGQGEELEGPYLENNMGQVFRNIFDARAFDLVEVMIKKKLIETDIYALDSFDRSVFAHICQYLRESDEAEAFLSGFLQKVSSINDEVKDQTLLGFCLDNGAAPFIIKALISAGCSTSYKNNAEQNFIYLVVSKPMMAYEKARSYLELLIAEGVGIDDQNVTGTTALMVAVQRREEDMVRLLLENGADPNIQDKKGNTVFYYAVCEQQDHNMYELLSQYASPDFELVNGEGKTLLNEYLRMMQGYESEIPLLEKMIKDGADLTQETLYYGEPRSGLDWIAEKAPVVLEHILALDTVDINALDNSGNTLLHKVCAYNVNFSADEAKNIYRKVKMLLEAGADASLTNDRDETALMLAQQDNLKIKTVELLLQHK